jgi:hypothetical protein
MTLQHLIDAESACEPKARVLPRGQSGSKGRTGPTLLPLNGSTTDSTMSKDANRFPSGGRRQHRLQRPLGQTPAENEKTPSRASFAFLRQRRIVIRSQQELPLALGHVLFQAAAANASSSLRTSLRP